MGFMVVFCFHPSGALQLLGSDAKLLVADVCSTVCLQKSHNTLFFLWNNCYEAHVRRSQSNLTSCFRSCELVAGQWKLVEESLNVN